MKSNFLYLETTFKVYSWIHNFINGIKKWHFNPCELVKPTKKKQFMHSCQLYIIDMHIRHVNYNENYKSFF